MPLGHVHSLCVYCGSHPGLDPGPRAAAAALGRALARSRTTLVFGGGRVGLMGVIADACLGAGGTAVGIIPRHLHDIEVGHQGVSELVVVPNMHERKRQMAERADAFAVLPGGLGTLDELFEILTWRQLGLHDLPILVLDLDGYWAPLTALIDHAVASGFARASHRALLQVVPTVDALTEALRVARPPAFAFRDRWA